MELSCIHSPTLGSIPRSVLSEKQFLRGSASLKLPAHNRTCPGSRNPGKFLDFGALPPGTFKIKSQAQDSSLNASNQKDGNIVFVAGATGKVGSRTVRELLKLGFRVRGGVRSIQRAKSLKQSVENMKLEDVKGGAKPIDNFELVECDLEKPEQIRPALGNSSIVVCCIGASEKEILDITGPYRIDFQATKNLIDVATSAKTKHFILLTSLGTNKVGFPAAILNLFWGVLCWKRKAEEALLASGLPYTIVRPGGMERPTDSFKETHNITLSEEDTLFGGLVSNLQVAELIAFMAKNRSLSYCKVVEVIAETSAPLTPLGDLLEKIPSQRKEIRSFKESDDLDGSRSVVQDSASSSTEKKPEQISAAKVVPKTKHASSPYINYEDLKPPSSPTPTPSGSKKEPSSIASTSTETEVTTEMEVTVPLTGGNNDVAKKEVLASSSHSPYLAYESLKPPSSPSPSVPVLSGNNKPVESPVDDKPSGNIVTRSESKGRPLSPYAMYEDLKPPGSPRKL